MHSSRMRTTRSSSHPRGVSLPGGLLAGGSPCRGMPPSGGPPSRGGLPAGGASLWGGLPAGGPPSRGVEDCNSFVNKNKKSSKISSLSILADLVVIPVYSTEHNHNHPQSCNHNCSNNHRCKRPLGLRSHSALSDNISASDAKNA